MSILSKIAGDIESAIGMKGSSAPVNQAPTQPAAQQPRGPQTAVSILTGGAAKAGVPVASGVPPELMQLALNAPPGVEPNSYALGLAHGHAAASQPGDLRVAPVANQPQFPQSTQTYGPPAGGYQHLNPTVIRNNY